MGPSRYVYLTKPVGEEIGKGHVLRTHEAARRELALAVEIDHRAQRGSTGQLDSAPGDPGDLATIDPFRKRLLGEPPSPIPGRRCEYDDHVLHRHQYREFEELLEEIVVATWPEIRSEQADLGVVTGVAYGLAREILDLPRERFAKRAWPA